VTTNKERVREECKFFSYNREFIHFFGIELIGEKIIKE